MGLRVSFDLEDDDLNHFRLIMRESRKAAAKSSPEDIIEGASSLLEQVGSATVPLFIKERLQKLELMIRMLSDAEWRLPAKESARVLNALAYFHEPEDLIPDHIPGLGFLDDAIMIELVVRELRHEIEAYADFCEYRQRKAPAAGKNDKSADATREEWLAARRKELQSRMRRRRKRNDQSPASRSPRVL
ncbi:MAG: YkvA family protein [Woeseiaceae bacterium]